MRRWMTSASLIGACMVLGTVGVDAQSSETAGVGDGSVLVGQVGTRADIALDDDGRAAAAAALSGKPIGIVLVQGFMGEAVTEDAPEAQGAKAAIEALGATPVMCDRVEFRRRQARCGKQPIDAAVVLQFFPAAPFTAPERLVKDGFAIVVLEAPSEEAPIDGRVRLRTDITAAGLEEGRAAGAWAASAWPDLDMVAAIQPVDPAPDPFFDAVSQGLLESLPSATVVPQSTEPSESSTPTCTPVPSGSHGRHVAGGARPRGRGGTDGGLLHHLPRPVGER